MVIKHSVFFSNNPSFTESSQFILLNLSDNPQGLRVSPCTYTLSFTFSVPSAFSHLASLLFWGSSCRTVCECFWFDFLFFLCWGLRENIYRITWGTCVWTNLSRTSTPHAARIFKRNLSSVFLQFTGVMNNEGCMWKKTDCKINITSQMPHHLNWPFTEDGVNVLCIRYFL